jgi:gluconokinase
VFEAFDEAMAKIVERNMPVAAVSMCTFWHNVAGLDEQGHPLTPLISWNDNRPGRVLPELAKRIDPDEFFRRTGCPFHASYHPAKILWLHQAMPEEARQVTYWMSVGETLFYRFFKQRVCSVSMASSFGLMHGERCDWDDPLLSIIPARREQFSPIQNETRALTGLDPVFASRWPQLKDALWFPPLGDGACSNIGCGCTTPERLTLMIGTSGAMRSAWRGVYQEAPKGLWCYRIDAKRPIQGGALSNGGNLFDWMFSTLRLPSIPELESELAHMKPDGHGLIVMPFFSGQRSPNWNPHSVATIHGMHTSTRPIEILQAGLEAVAYRFAMVHRLLKPKKEEKHILVASGGALLHSPVWIQMMADVIGQPVRVSTIAEASSRGAALHALEAMGVVEDLDQTEVHLGTSYEPRAEPHAIYQRALERSIEFEKRVAGA